MPPSAAMGIAGRDVDWLCPIKPISGSSTAWDSVASAHREGRRHRRQAREYLSRFIPWRWPMRWPTGESSLAIWFCWRRWRRLHLGFRSYPLVTCETVQP